jgi:flavin-dependent dehydrogenase
LRHLAYDLDLETYKELCEEKLIKQIDHSLKVNRILNEAKFGEKKSISEITKQLQSGFDNFGQELSKSKKRKLRRQLAKRHDEKRTKRNCRQ